MHCKLKCFFTHADAKAPQNRRFSSREKFLRRCQIKPVGQCTSLIMFLSASSRIKLNNSGAFQIYNAEISEMVLLQRRLKVLYVSQSY